MCEKSVLSLFSIFNIYFVLSYILTRNMPGILHDINEPCQKATFGMGCFWANDALFGATHGVLRTRVGYSGGTSPNPTYKNISDHTEVTEIDYDPSKISFGELLDLFWANHEYGFVTPIKKQYASLILYHNNEQKELAELSLKKKLITYDSKITTEILPADTFYAAEDYHQKYRLQQHPLIYETLGLTSELLQFSHAATKLNGYVAGVGSKKDLEKDLAELGLPDVVADYVRREWRENEGGTLYC
ncbi:Peptide methionine sulfoxide reductase [Popillia japonica]|uniref:peptide-methionine (S)-S-oxide reductase n=1 Tax=Popillia japonica TaxID=7064 RepID=A0AAW1JYK7_POPJA